jgi:hypothetical protein
MDYEKLATQFGGKPEEPNLDELATKFGGGVAPAEPDLHALAAQFGGTIAEKPQDEMKAWEPSAFEEILNVGKRGLLQAEATKNALAFHAGLMDAATYTEKTRELDRRMGAATPSGDVAAGLERLQKANETGSYSETAAALLKPENWKALGALVGESAIATAENIPAVVAGGITAGPPGAAAASGATSFAAEYGAAIGDLLEKKGISPTDTLAVRNALEDPKFLAEARERGLKRGIPVAAFDALSAGFAGKFMRTLEKAAGVKAVSKATAKEAGLQIGSGMAGEAVGQAATGENKPLDVLIEGLAELPGGVAEAGSNIYHARREQPSTANINMGEEVPPTPEPTQEGEQTATAEIPPTQPAAGAEGVTNVGQPIDETGGVSPELAGQSDQVAPAGGVEKPTANGVVPAGENVGSATEGAGAQQPALTLPTAKKGEAVMPIQDGAKQPIPMSALTTPEALARASKVLNTSNPEQELVIAARRGGLSTAEAEEILGAPVTPTAPEATQPEPIPAPKITIEPAYGVNKKGNEVRDGFDVFINGEWGNRYPTKKAAQAAVKAAEAEHQAAQAQQAAQVQPAPTQEPTQQGAQVGTETPQAIQAEAQGQEAPAAPVGVTPAQQVAGTPQAPTAATTGEAPTEEEQKQLEALDANVRDIYQKSYASTKFKNRGIKQRAIEKLKPKELMNWVKSFWPVATKAQREVIARLPSIEYLGYWVKDLGLNQILEASDLMTAMLGKQKVYAEQTEQLLHMLKQAFKEDPALQDKLSQLAYVSTNLEVDPSDPTTKRRLASLDADYAALGEKGQMLYKMAKQFGIDRADLYLRLLQENINDLQIDENEKKNLMTVLRKQYEASSRITPYFALVRDDGNYWLSVGEGDNKEFYIYDSLRDRDADRARIVSERGISEGDTKVGDSVESLRQATYEASSFLRAVFDAIDAAPATKKEGTEASTAKYKENLKDAVYQTYLNVMPEKSFRGMFQHRKGRAGYRTDLVQNIAATGVKMNGQLAKLEYAQKIRNTVDSAQAAIEGREGLQPFADELRRRVDALLSPAQQNGWDVLAGAAGRLGFTYMLAGLSLPLLQPLALASSGMSILWGNYKTNPAKAGAALLNAFANIPQYGFTTELPDGSVRYHWPSLVNSKTLTGDELRAVQDLAKSGVHESTLAREVWEHASNPTSSYVKEPGKELEYYTARTMKGLDTLVGSPFHIMERWTREALFLAAYRLGRTDGLGHDAAVQKAFHNIKEALGDYDMHAKPVWMQRGLGKMAFALKTFSILITQQTLGNLFKAIPFLNKEGKVEAIKKFSGIMLTMSVFAGASGVPLASVLYGAAAGLVLAMGGAGDDDDDDAELRKLDSALWFRSVWLPKHIPNVKIGGVSMYDWIDRGAINAITGLDVASRVQVASNWGSDTVRSGKTALDSATNLAVDLIGGAYYSMLKQFFNAYDAYSLGDTQKAKELVAPKPIRDWLKADRYEEEGVEFNHAPVLGPDQLKKLEIWGQRIGFTPDLIAVTQKEGIKGKNATIDAQNERNRLITKLELAEINAMKSGKKGAEGEAEFMRLEEEELAKFNAKFPDFQLNGEDIAKALRARADMRENAIAGVAVGKNQVNALAPLLERMENRLEERRQEMRK